MADSSRTADEDFPVPLVHEQPAGFSMAASVAAGDANAATSSSSPQTQRQARGQARAPKTPRPCKFYITKTGCKNGDACPFSHDPELRQGSGDDRSSTAQVPGSGRKDPVSDRQSNQSAGAVRHTARGAPGADALATRRHLPTVDPSRVVRRPAPAGENNPEVRRKNEISQLKRRWGDLFQEVDQEQGVYRLELKQSEDFPYDLDALRVEISIPPDYPKASSEGPSIKVLNEDIPKGHQVNIERGFSSLVKSASTTTRLLDLLNNLDKRLESFLSSEKAPTFKIVPNIGAVVQEVVKLDVNDHQAQTQEPTSQILQAPLKLEHSKLTYTEAQKEAARSRRALETRQLEARFRQSPVFWKNSIGTLYKVPLEPRMKNMLPAGLLLLNSADLRVPELYPLEPCRITFDRSFPESITRSIENGFLKRAQEKPEVSLMAQLNYLAQNIHTMIEVESEKPVQKPVVEIKTVPQEVPEAGPSVPTPASPAVVEKPRIIIVEKTRPPEWELDDSESDSEEFSSSDEDREGEAAGSSQGLQQDSEAVDPVYVSSIERGTSISFPDIKLKNIELLELKTINLTMKCNRCKTVADINNIKAKENKHSRPKLLGCEKCASVIGIDFRREFIHENHARAGFLDLSGCTVVDLLPSEFVPTCAGCSTTLTAGIQGVTRSQTMFANCRSCFAKMSLFIPEIRFLKISEDDVDLGAGGRVRRQKENLGLVAGTELPLRGKSSSFKGDVHTIVEALDLEFGGDKRLPYLEILSGGLTRVNAIFLLVDDSKSTRWFRFSCCNKVFPCDKCHDSSVEPRHPSEHANRMICGACSREQNYRPDDCAFCRHSFVAKNSGFWEGGKGTRDKAKMSRKDPRKYKRVNV
ncbi:hypothetical protein TWF730_009782 [Orbilia blumenaviensis]|uniref:C3H1-type domain-containing protein n=1 Tax=Orbilia blumenaviensis TaxID=1796055 RepID=A0AAV9UU62_9PEZI